MRLTINIPDPPKQCLISDISFHFQDGQLVEYTSPSGWVVKEQPKTDNKCQECKKDWTKCTRCPVMMKWVVEMQNEASPTGAESEVNE